MARLETSVTITESNRDTGKTFNIREMPPMQSEEWFARAIRVLASASVEVPADLFQQGAQGFAAIGISTALMGLAKAPWEEVKALMGEMMTCIVSATMPIPTGGQGPPLTILSQILHQIEEVSTLARLREEILSLHVGFSIAAYFSIYRDAAVKAMTNPGSTTEISQDQSE